MSNENFTRRSSEFEQNSENIASRISITTHSNNNNNNNNNRQPTRIQPSSHVCRNLFGNAETTALHENFENSLYESLRTARERWNFDFENEQPLPGKWQWEKVTNDASSPTIMSNISNVSTDTSTEPPQCIQNDHDIPEHHTSNESIETDYIELPDNDVLLQS